MREEKRKEQLVIYSALFLGLRVWSRHWDRNEGKFLYIRVAGGDKWNPLDSNNDAFELLTKGNLWAADDVAQRFEEHRYAENPEKEIRRIVTEAAAARWLKQEQPIFLGGG